MFSATAELQMSLMLISRNLDLMQAAADACREIDDDSPEARRLLLLQRLLARRLRLLKESVPGNAGYDEVCNDILDMTIDLINAYEAVWPRVRGRLGMHRILSPGPYRGATARSETPPSVGDKLYH